MADNAVHPGAPESQPEPCTEFLRVAREIAESLGADPMLAMQGEPLDYGGLTFTLRQHGELDPSGLVVAIETDPLFDGMAAVQCKSLLRQHLLMPPALGGYYALSPSQDMPSQDIVLFCFRVDLRGDRQPAALVQALLDKALQQRQQIARVFAHELPDEMRAELPDEHGEESAARHVEPSRA